MPVKVEKDEISNFFFKEAYLLINLAHHDLSDKQRIFLCIVCADIDLGHKCTLLTLLQLINLV